MIWLKYIVPLLLWTCCNSQNVCNEPPGIDFGEIVSDEKVEYQNGDRVQYRCFPGYALEGPEWRTCKGPEWTPEPKCLAPCTIRKQQLEAKNLFLSGGQRYSVAVPNNQTLEFLCREGYVLSTPSFRKCIDGHMDLPSCISERGKNCSGSPTIENGDITALSQKQYTSGSSVEFKCQQYFTMEGQSRSFCDNGNWTKVPVCLEPCVMSLAEIEKQNISVKLRSNGDEIQTLYLPRGDSIEFSCKPGHVLATNHAQSVFEFQCRGRPIVLPECKEIVCLHPEVSNGMVSPHRQQYSDEDTIQIQCDPGYEPEHQQETSKCTKDGWLPQPKCVSKRCNYPEGENIVVSGYPWRYRDFYFPKREGAYIDTKCNNGFLPANKEIWQRSTCTKSGWNPEPKCFKQCEHRRGFPHGNFVYLTWHKFIEGNDISFSCDMGYYPEQQEAKTKCTKNGWSPTPRCISSEIPTCESKPLLNGFFTDRKDQFALNERTRYSCQIGFTTREGHEEGETQCLRGGWSPKPECISK
ncbi:complement factor H-like [Heteronotia binoei]|uniref:complement factor H-like n=1 Tax=Heteronotia binoei TaxID=13085 RepID=UPI0029303D13|nr:complement factor H-like [Heteronotia binoei]